MDCHVTNTTESTWTLVGVYKESLEVSKSIWKSSKSAIPTSVHPKLTYLHLHLLFFIVQFDNDTFFEQLFKHQGVCLWGGDNSNYQFMQTMREDDMANFDGGCYKVESGIYIGTKPVEGGDLELAIYSDTYCMTEISSYSVDDYISSSTGKSWTNAFSKWNSMMDAYKICQPCRAYSKYYNTQDDWHRKLVEYEDGQGNEEANGFNCYDDAGYRK